MDKKYTVGDSSFPAKEILKDLEPMTKDREKIAVSDVGKVVGDSAIKFLTELVKEVLMGK